MNNKLTIATRLTTGKQVAHSLAMMNGLPLTLAFSEEFMVYTEKNKCVGGFSLSVQHGKEIYQIAGFTPPTTPLPTVAGLAAMAESYIAEYLLPTLERARVIRELGNIAFLKPVNAECSLSAIADSTEGELQANISNVPRPFAKRLCEYLAALRIKDSLSGRHEVVA